jgi:prepilin-type N-terminal cleavage/methylation domain-containing protein
VLQRFRKVHENEDGFTLTELLITIVILGVLAGIVVFAVSAFTNDGKTVSCQTDKKNVEVAVEAYHAKTGLWPTNAVDNTDHGRIQVLIDTLYLKDQPSTTHGYTITVDPNTGAVGPAACP